MWDSHCQDGLWESLDDWVYFIRSDKDKFFKLLDLNHFRGIGNTVEFFFAVFLFFNGGWILIFESGGTIRAVMMLIHAYFNIWCEARNGWSAFMKRRSAVSKINSLQDATKEEIEAHNDVCAICYQEMSTAKITKCRHMFHSICLRKWLYMQVSYSIVFFLLWSTRNYCRITAQCVTKNSILARIKHKLRHKLIAEMIWMSLMTAMNLMSPSTSPILLMRRIKMQREEIYNDAPVL